MKAFARFGRPLLLLGGLAAIGLVLRQSGLSEGMRQAGAHGPLAFVLLGTTFCAVGLPRQAVAYAGGLAFGAGPGTALARVAEVAGAGCSFIWARFVARAWAARWLDRHSNGRIGRLRARLGGQPFAATLTLRLLPIGNSLVLTLFAGAAGLPAAPFLLASAVGFAPQTVVFALLGDGVQVDSTLQVLLGLILLVVSGALGMALMRRTTVDLPERAT